MNGSFSLSNIDREKVRTPAQFYRMMRPECFSDSTVEAEKMTRDQFKFIMSQIAIDQRHDAFEDFTRRCIQKLITPNIIPQTGPTGGGDGKADLVSFPVSNATSSLWIVPEGGSSGNEKWAFAISSVHKWSTKMDSDVKKIMDNLHGITRIYFCTNQAVASRSRLAKQKKYQDEYRIDTVILDLNWYVQAVFDQGCYDDAVEALGLGESLKQIKKMGPLDIKRENRLAEIDKKLPKTEADGFDDAYVGELIEAAILSRGLEKPQQEVYGRFAVALNAARKYGLPQQVYECIYQKAWTDFYWYDNVEATYENYCELKMLLGDEVNVTRIEKLFTLFQIIFVAYGEGLFTKIIDVQKEYSFFKELYDRLAAAPARSSCSLYLQICLLEFELMQRAPVTDDYDEKRINVVIDHLIDALRKAAYHLDIHFDSQADILATIGQLYVHNNGFDELVDVVADIQSSRDRDISAASIHYQRGFQNLESRNYKDAIRHLSKSYVLYQKENTLTELVRTSSFLAYAYSHVDLLYSAKVYYVKALSLLLISMGNKGRSDHLIVTILLQLCENELNLGQIVSFLEWLSILDGYVALLPNYLDKDLVSDRSRLDALLGSLIYESPLNDDSFSVLPDILERHQLEFSRNVLMIKMGKRDSVSKEFGFLLDNEESTQRFVAQMSDHAHFLFPLTINHDKKGVLHTLVHGCTIRARYEGATYEQTFSEMVLACMELLLESRVAKCSPSTPVLDFVINCMNDGETQIQQSSMSEFIVLINKNTFDSQGDVWDIIIKMMANLFSGSVMVKDLGSFLETRQKDDFLMHRLSLLTSYLSDIKNVIPNYRNAFIETFVKQSDRRYRFKKDEKSKNPNRANKQSDAIITSLIDTRLWDAAKWHGCGYLIARDFSEPGILVLLYENIGPGIKIFEQWENDFHNKKLNIRIVFITGVDENHPDWYKVLITPDVNSVLKQQLNPSERFVISAARFHLMNANTNENLVRLRQVYGRYGFIGISASAIINNQMSFDKDKRYNKVIPVQNVDFREAWTIGENEPESVAILPSDKVIIPSDHKEDAPVIKVLSRKQQNGNEES